MTKREKFDACKNFFEKLADILSNDYEMIGSPNYDTSIYLVPNGTESQLTYYGKPLNSFRVSDHWNWYTSLKKCEIPNFVQCCSIDMPAAKKRLTDWKFSDPVKGCQVAIFGKDKKYHCVYGEKYDKKTKSWSWLDADPYEVASLIS